MKVKRQNISEEYSTTVGWVKDFERNILKDANFLETLRNRHYNQRVFSSVEDKMDDMKERVGFDLIAKFKDKDDDLIAANVVMGTCSQEASGGGECSECSAGNECGCGDGLSQESMLSEESEFDQKDLDIVGKLLEYIRNKASYEHTLPGSVIVNNSIDSLGNAFEGDDVSLNIEKLIEYANDVKADSKAGGCEPDDLEYFRYEPSGSDDANDTADYYDHASP